MDPAMIETEVKRPNIFVEILKFTVGALIIVTPIRFFVAQPFIVSGASMEPTFEPKEYLVIDELTYRFSKPERGDIVIFKYPLDSSIYFIKRVVGLPGETIIIKDGEVMVQNQTGEFKLSEPYLKTEIPSREKDTVTLAEDEYYVLGDNRTASSDSREWGVLQEQYLVGRAFARLFPFSDIEILPGEYRY